MLTTRPAARRIPLQLVRPRIVSRSYFWRRTPRVSNAKKPSTRTWYEWSIDSLLWSAQASYKFLGFALATHVFAEYFFWIDPVYGISMIPTFNGANDSVILSKYYRKGRGVKVGDVVSFKHPLDEREGAVKRIVGMPGDFVLRDTPGEGSQEMIQLPEGHCYVAGDNQRWSRDSRAWGPLPLALINGKVIARISGFSFMERIKNGLQPYAGDEDDVD